MCFCLHFGLLCAQTPPFYFLSLFPCSLHFLSTPEPYLTYAQALCPTWKVPGPSQSFVSELYIACHVLQELLWLEPFVIYFGDVFLREHCCDCRCFFGFFFCRPFASLSAPHDDLDARFHHSADEKS